MQELLADPNSPWHEYRGRGPITKNQVAALLRDYDIRPVVVHPTKRADFSRHGYRTAQSPGRVCAFLAPRAEHPNTQARARGDVMFGCSDVYHWMGRAAKARGAGGAGARILCALCTDRAAVDPAGEAAPSDAVAGVLFDPIGTAADGAVGV